MRLVASRLAAGLALRHLPDRKIAIRNIRLINTSLKIVTDAASRVRLLDRYVVHPICARIDTLNPLLVANALR